MVFKFHEEKKGKIEIKPKVNICNNKNLCLAYTPGVAEISKVLAKNPNLAYKYTIKGNSVAIVTDGSAVLGLGNIGPYPAIPVMEGKSVIFKNYANIDAFPVCLNTQDPDEIVKIVENISPIFGGINLEDISAPNCFEVERKLKKSLDIPIFHDDQHGTAIVVLAGLINALKLVDKKFENIKVVISGSGAAGIAILKLLHAKGVRKIVMLDSRGVISEKRKDLPKHKKELFKIIDKDSSDFGVKEAFNRADVLIGVSKGGVVKAHDIKAMNQDPIVLALANPIPEIMPEIAKKAGAKIIATGRSDYPNQLNNALVFPGFFRGLLDTREKNITQKMKINAAHALAGVTIKPTINNIIASIFNKKVVPAIAQAVRKSVK